MSHEMIDNSNLLGFKIEILGLWSRYMVCGLVFRNIRGLVYISMNRVYGIV
jgi:hypothetical protein